MEQKTVLKNRLTPEQEQARTVQIKAAHATQRKLMRESAQRVLQRLEKEENANSEPAISDTGGAG